MAKKLIIHRTVVLMLFIGLTGCIELGSQDNPQQVDSAELARFVGTWIHNYAFGIETIICFTNGTCSWNNISGYYNLKDSKFVIDLPSLGNIYTFDYSFSNNDNTLTLTMSGGTPLDYIKQ